MTTTNAASSGLRSEKLPFYLKKKGYLSLETLCEGTNGQIEGGIGGLEHDIASRDQERSCYRCEAGGQGAAMFVNERSCRLRRTNFFCPS